LGDARSSSGSADDGLVDLAQGGHVVGTYVEDVGLAVIHCLNAGGGEVLGVDELVAVAAIADDPDLRPSSMNSKRMASRRGVPRR